LSHHIARILLANSTADRGEEVGQEWRPWIVRPLLGIAFAFGVQVSALGQGLFTFKDKFDSYTHLQDLESLTKWEANPPPTGPYVNKPGSDGSAVIPIRAGGLANAFIQPMDDSNPLNPVPANWPFARTCEQFLRVEFDLSAQLPSGSSTASGVMGLYFTTDPTFLGGLSDSGPLAAVQVSWASGSSLSVAQIYGKEPGGAGNIKAIGAPINLGSLASLRSLRIDFAWDYFISPHDFGAGGPNNYPSLAEPWTYLRVAWLDSGTNQWKQPDLGPGRNGWAEFGTASPDPTLYGNALKSKTAFHRYDWRNGTVYYPVYVHWFAEQGSVGGDVDWTIDNVTIHQVQQPPFTVMSNELGYDTAGPQWVAMRPNDPAVRSLGANALSALTWTLYDSSGVVIPGYTYSPTLLTGEPCFQDVRDPEAGPGLLFDQLYWWRWEWSPPIRTPIQGCYVEATGTTSGTPSIAFSLRSDPFDIQPDLAYASVIAAPNNIAAKNGQMRHAVTNSLGFTWQTSPPASSGWFDASNENGENRAHGAFVTALSQFLLARRSEMSTADVRQLVAEIRWGADFLVSMQTPQNTSSARLTAHKQQGSTFDKTLASHHLTYPNPTAEETSGHIFHEHESRYKGHAISSLGGDLDDSGNSGNNQRRMYVATLGLFDAARGLKGFVASPATTVDVYFAAADQARTFLYHLQSLYTGSGAYIPQRAQAMLDVASYGFSGATADVNAAVLKMGNDLSSYPPTTAGNIEGYWILCDQLVLGPNGWTEFSPYTPFEPLLYFLEHGIGSAATWQAAVQNIGDKYYHLELLPGTGNPLRITRFWHPVSIDAVAFNGDDKFTNGAVAEEVLAAARLAMNETRSGSNYERFVQLATGNLNWLLGLHRGVASRHVQSASGVADSDLEFSGASFVSQIGRRFGIQVVYGYHSADWTQPTTVSGFGGESTGSGTTSNWSVAPFDYGQGNYVTSESYIKADGAVLTAIETLGRVLHPRGVIEAENFSLKSSSTASTQSNNEWNVGGVDRPNGGLSVVDLSGGDTLQYLNVLPPETNAGSGASNLFNYTLLLRASNYSSGNVTVNITIASPGYTTWSASVTLAPSSAPDKHEYVIYSTPTSNPISMHTGSPYSITLQFGGGPMGMSIDDLVLVSGGVMQ